jgi:hypothetical protein
MDGRPLDYTFFQFFSLTIFYARNGKQIGMFPSANVQLAIMFVVATIAAFVQFVDALDEEDQREQRFRPVKVRDKYIQGL